MTDANVVTLPSPAPRSPVQAPAAPPDDGISAMSWLREMREMRHEQQKERAAQTDAFVAAMDRLGSRVDANIGEMRVEMRRHLNVLVTTFVVSLVVLAALAGATVYVKGFGVTASTTAPPSPTVPAAAPVPAP
jgi:hypothetical protein